MEKRYIVSGSNGTTEDLINIMKKEFEKYGYILPSKKVTPQEIKDSGNGIAIRILPMLGKVMKLNNERSKTELKLNYRDLETSVIDAVLSFISLGLLEDKINK